ncbi:TPA: flagellin, partial [Candidatus Poribacteria bacterium]|nr:flagellin [Candidatus Poribacteria bacterium]
AITAIDHAIDEINRERSYIGSEQNKPQFTMSNLTSQTQNVEASRSSTEDADFAAEAADLAKNQILAQSATAMLAQASAISQNVLGLLS